MAGDQHTRPSPARRRVSVVLFEGFELLDVFGPVELFGLVPGLTVDCVGPQTGAVRSSHGPRAVADLAYADVVDPDILLVPGGQGTRALVHDAEMLSWLRRVGEDAAVVASVCTGSAVLAAAGLLEGRRATTNKRAFDWASAHGSAVEWVPRARWVHDGDRWTSSGVTAGMDMAHAMIAELVGPEAAAEAVRRAEYTPRPDPDDDPFAAVHGLA